MGLLNSLVSMFSSACVSAEQKQRDSLKTATVMKKQKAYDMAVLKVREALELTRKHELGITCQELGRIGDYLVLANRNSEAFDEFMKIAACHYTPHWLSADHSRISTLSFGIQKAGGVLLNTPDALRGRAMNIAGFVLWGVCFRDDGETKKDFTERAKSESEAAIEEIECEYEDEMEAGTLKRVTKFAKEWIASPDKANHEALCDRVYALIGGNGKCIDGSILLQETAK